MDRTGDTIDLANREVTRAGEQAQMWSNIAGKTADTIISQNKSLTENAQQTGTTTITTPPPSGSSTPDQLAYATPYEKSAARPTVVNININELAHFDRTSVASSAQERDLMAAMEDKIAESIYRLSMTALNNVGSHMA